LEIKEVLDFILKKIQNKKPLVLTFFENLENQRTSTSIFSTFKKKPCQFSQKNKRLAKIWQFYRRLCDLFLDFLMIAGIYKNWFTDL
jgi:hypothetical protein